MNSRRSYRIGLVVSVWLGLAACCSLSAVELTGSLTSELYTWTEELADHIRPYQRLNSNFSFASRSDKPTLDWYTSLRWTTDFSDKFDSDPQWNVYQSYFRFGHFFNKTELRLGRMFIYNGITSSFVDGFYMRGLSVAAVEVDLYAGSRVDPLDPESVRSVADYLSAGSRIKWGITPNVNLLHSTSITRDEGEAEQLLSGLELDYGQDYLYLITRGIYDIFDRRLSTITGQVRYSDDRWNGVVQVGSLYPVVRPNSIFALIDTDRREEARLSLGRVFKDDWRLTGSVKLSLVENNDATLVAFGVRSSRYYLLWTHQSGDQSSASGVRGGASGTLFESWRLFVSGGYNSYMVQDEIESDLTTWHARTGLTKRLSNSLEARVELQILSNPDTKDDVRGLVSLSKFFDIGGEE